MGISRMAICSRWATIIYACCIRLATAPTASVCWWGDRVHGEEAWFALTGDTLFVGNAGRPDLDADEGTGDATAAASTLYDSLQKLLALPDDLEIYPSHFAGSACGRAISGKPSSTIGFERRHNPALHPRSRAEFIDFMLADLPAAPAEHQRIRQINREGRRPALSGL